MKPAIRLGLLLGLPLAAFVAWSPFHPIEHALWRSINNYLVVATLAGVVLLGWKVRSLSWRTAGAAIVCYTGIVAALHMTAYLITTGFLADGMKWIPFFQRDYQYHGFTSVRAYLLANNNFVELAELNLFAWTAWSLAYALLGGLAAAVSRGFAGSRFLPHHEPDRTIGA